MDCGGAEFEIASRKVISSAIEEFSTTPYGPSCTFNSRKEYLSEGDDEASYSTTLSCRAQPSTQTGVPKLAFRRNSNQRGHHPSRPKLFQSSIKKRFLSMPSATAPGRNAPNPNSAPNEVVHLPKGVRGELETVLASNLDFKGSFYHSKTYSEREVPNPILNIQQVGRIGLPLSQAEAQRVIEKATQAPFGQGERTIVDTNVRDTWEIDGASVQFDNPAWKGWLHETMGGVCKALGVKTAIGWRPHKLLIYEKGSHFLPHQDTEKDPGMFATVIIVLPSQFTGGAVHLKLGNDTRKLDVSATSLTATSVMAWYTDVTHEVKPITSGFRFALSYNLIHTGSTAAPTMGGPAVVSHRLRRVFLGWRQDLANNPRKIIYLLKHKYSHVGMKGTLLKSSDAHKVALVRPIAEELGFRVGLATVECVVEGAAEDFGDYDSDPYAEEVSDVGGGHEMVEETGRKMNITHLVDLTGAVLSEELELSEDFEETIPEDLESIVVRGKPDDEEYEGYQGNYGGSLEHFYRRTALVIWPLCFDDELIEELPLFDNALDFLRDARGAAPDLEDSQVWDFVLDKAIDGDYQTSEALEALSAAACQWKDWTLWMKAYDDLEGSEGLENWEEGALWDPIQAFGMEVMAPKLDQIIENSTEADRDAFLDGLEQEMGDVQVVAKWIKKYRKPPPRKGRRTGSKSSKRR